MREIVVISGKGGTGKTSISAAFTMLGGKDLVVADCDVDAADMHLLLQPDFHTSGDFYSGQLAEIDTLKCTDCGKCADVCRFNAISVIDGNFTVNPLKCEGCGYCSRVCPSGAILNIQPKVGQWYVSEIKNGTTMVHAKLGIGADNSGKLVAKVKNEARRVAAESSKTLILVDGAPGIGCPVVSSLSGAALVVLVTEPTVSGLHDLKRVYQLVKKFKINAACIINKHDLNPDITKQINDFMKEEGILQLCKLPYSPSFTRAMIQGKTIIEYDDVEIKASLVESWDTIISSLNNKPEFDIKQ
jgi:MinD superfamily P-loop ATPase